jgi:hypothetical protein
MTNAVLLRKIPLVVRDVSSGGCLIESCTPLQIGTVGWLEVEFEGQCRVEWFRIARVFASGERAFVSGAEFLPLAAAGANSLRSAIGRLRQSTSASASPEVAGRSSGDPRNSDGHAAGAPAQPSSKPATFAGKIVNFARRR